MRKLLASVLLVIVLWQLLGFAGYFEFSRYQIRKEIKTLLKNGVDKKDLIFFTLSSTEYASLKWVKKNEFVCGDHFYDVVREEKGKGIYSLQCISDDMETVLFAKLDQTVSMNQTQKNSSVIINWFELLISPYFPVNELSLHLNDFSEEDRIFFKQLFATLWVDYELTIGPPEEKWFS